LIITSFFSPTVSYITNEYQTTIYFFTKSHTTAKTISLDWKYKWFEIRSSYTVILIHICESWKAFHLYIQLQRVPHCENEIRVREHWRLFDYLYFQLYGIGLYITVILWNILRLIKVHKCLHPFFYFMYFINSLCPQNHLGEVWLELGWRTRKQSRIFHFMWIDMGTRSVALLYEK